MPTIKKSGTGITQREHATYNLEDPEDVDAAIAAIDSLGRDWFWTSIERLEATARRILERHGLPTHPKELYVQTAKGWRSATKREVSSIRPLFSLEATVRAAGLSNDSPAGYAARSLTLAWYLRGQIDRADAKSAAAFAYDLGHLIAESSMKFRWEPSAITGKKQRDFLDDTRTRLNTARHQERAEEWARWNKAAAPHWKPDRGRQATKVDERRLSKNAIARIVKTQLGLADSVKTIADRLKKPREAG